jgi:hypothetical protein
LAKTLKTIKKYYFQVKQTLNSDFRNFRITGGGFLEAWEAMNP